MLNTPYTKGIRPSKNHDGILVPTFSEEGWVNVYIPYRQAEAFVDATLKSLDQIKQKGVKNGHSTH